MPTPRPDIGTIAQRATVTGLLGLGVWGLWLTGAVYKSRRGEGAQQNLPPSQQHPLHDPKSNQTSKHAV
ncbi:unnamed protein product [Sympodiomycopsis kandeliae]